jgi:transposase
MGPAKVEVYTAIGRVHGTSFDKNVCEGVSEIIGETDKAIWRVLHHYVEAARLEEDRSSVKYIGIDETAKARGHNYITVVVDIAESKVIYVGDGRDSAAISKFRADLGAHNCKAENIEIVCSDMSQAYISGIEQEFPDAQITFDKFHVTKMVNDAVDEVRREEQKSNKALKKTRWLWLKNQGK